MIGGRWVEENNIEEYLESWSTIPGIFLDMMHIFINRIALKVQSKRKKRVKNIKIRFRLTFCEDGV